MAEGIRDPRRDHLDDVITAEELADLLCEVGGAAYLQEAIRYARLGRGAAARAKAHAHIAAANLAAFGHRFVAFDEACDAAWGQRQAAVRVVAWVAHLGGGRG